MALQALLAVLRLAADASEDEIRTAVERELGRVRRKGQRTDPREELRQLAHQRAARKGIGFMTALGEIKMENPALIERAAKTFRRTP